MHILSCYYYQLSSYAIITFTFLSFWKEIFLWFELIIALCQIWLSSAIIIPCQCFEDEYLILKHSDGKLLISHFMLWTFLLTFTYFFALFIRPSMALLMHCQAQPIWSFSWLLGCTYFLLLHRPSSTPLCEQANFSTNPLVWAMAEKFCNKSPSSQQSFIFWLDSDVKK